MKLTKEVCLNAYMNLAYSIGTKNCGKNIVCDECENQCETRKQYDKDCSLIEQLIHEHFDNPPLKFEEIKKGMWVWNERDKEYAKVWRKYIASCHNDSYVEGTKVIKFIYQDGFTYSQEYKENEIHIKQVNENE